MSGTRAVRIHYHRPPDRTDVFEQALIEERPDVIVTYAPSAPLVRPAVADGRVILEPGAPAVWFTFPGAWHDIGRFHLADGTFTGLYANVLTPPEIDGPTWRTTDLFLDVWLPADGGPPRILDEDELEDAVAQGVLDGRTAERARAEARDLVAAARAGTWPPEVVRSWTLEAALERLGAADGTRR